MAYKQIKTGNQDLDRVQQEVASAFASLDDVLGAPVVTITASAQVQDTTLYAMVNAQRADVLIAPLPGRAAPLTIVKMAGPNTVKFVGTVSNGDAILTTAGASLTLVPSGGTWWLVSAYP